MQKDRVTGKEKQARIRDKKQKTQEERKRQELWNGKKKEGTSSRLLQTVGIQANALQHVAHLLCIARVLVVTLLQWVSLISLLLEKQPAQSWSHHPRGKSYNTASGGPVLLLRMRILNRQVL
jgi:hypothetical protein